MNFRITYLHNILYIKKGEKKNSDNMIKKWLIHTGRHQITPKK